MLKSTADERVTVSDAPLAPAVVTVGLDFIYQPQTLHIQALRQVNWDVPRGIVQMIMGPAGAGKTTLLMILAGLLTPTDGQVNLLGQTITHMSRQQLTQFRLRHIGMLFQEANLLAALTALENVEVAVRLKGVRGPAIRKTATELLDAVGLGDRTKHLPHQLSGGQQSRLSIARALAGQPDLLIADEPTAALDAENGQIVIKLLRQLATEHRCSVILATHDHRITGFADRIAYLEDGCLTDQPSVAG